MPQNIYNTLKEYLERNGNLKADNFKPRPKTFGVKLQGTQAKCGIRIKGTNNGHPYVEIQAYYGGSNPNDQSEFFQGYNALTTIAKLNTQQLNLPFKFNITLAYGINKGHWDFFRKSIDVRITKNNGDAKFGINTPDELEAIRNACETLIKIDEACINVQAKRKFINIDGENEVSQDILDKYLTEKFSNLQELLLNGTIGITRPTGDISNKNTYKARLWVEEEYLNEHPEIFSKEDISDSYWTETWQPTLDINNQVGSRHEIRQYWLLVADPAEFSFSDKKIGEQDFYTRLNKNGNQRQKPWCYETAKAGDKLICYEASPIQKVVAFGEICGKDDNNLYYKKTINLPIHLTRSELLEDSDLAKIFQSPQGSLLDLGSVLPNGGSDLTAHQSNGKVVKLCHLSES